VSLVIHTPEIAEEGQRVKPSAQKPFVVVIKAGQPIKLLVHRSGKGAPPAPGVKSLGIVVMPQGDVDIEALLERAWVALGGAPDAEGVVLVGSKGGIRGVLSTSDVLTAIRERSPTSEILGYEPLSGSDPDVQASLVYTCPQPGCDSPDVTIYQKGQEVPPCPIHHVPRVPKRDRE